MSVTEKKTYKHIDLEDQLLKLSLGQPRLLLAVCFDFCCDYHLGKSSSKLPDPYRASSDRRKEVC